MDALRRRPTGRSSRHGRPASKPGTPIVLPSWTVELEEEPRVHTWGKTVEQALTRMREAATLWQRHYGEVVTDIPETATTATFPVFGRSRSDPCPKR